MHVDSRIGQMPTRVPRVFGLEGVRLRTVLHLFTLARPGRKRSVSAVSGVRSLHPCDIPACDSCKDICTLQGLSSANKSGLVQIELDWCRQIREVPAKTAMAGSQSQGQEAAPKMKPRAKGANHVWRV